MFFDIDFDALLDERIAEVAEFSPEEAEALEFGATTVVGILSHIASEKFPESADVEALFDAVNPLVERLRVATIEAQTAEVEVEDECEDDEPQTYTDGSDRLPTDEEYAQINDLVEGLFAAMIGPEAAAEVRAEVERRDAEAGAKWGDPVDEATEETTPEQEVEDFLANLFGIRVA